MADEKVSTYLRAAIALRANGQTAEAAAEYRKVIALAPDHLAALLALGRMARVDGDLEIAAEYLLAASRRDPKDVNLRMEVGDLLRRTSRFEEATKAYESAMADDPAFAVKALTYLGLIARQTKDSASAAKYLERAYALDPHARGVKELLAEVQVKSTRREELVAPYMEALKQDPNDSHALAALGRIAGRAGEHGEARRLLEKASTIDPENPRILRGLAEVYRELGLLDDAEGAYKRALDVKSDDAEALSGIATIARMRGDAATAAEYLQAAGQLAPIDELTRRPGFQGRIEDGDRLVERLFPDLVVPDAKPKDVDYNKWPLLVAPQKGATSVLITFGGNTPQLMLPTEVLNLEDLHLIAIRDPHRTFSMLGVKGLGKSYSAAIEGLRRLIAELGATDVYVAGVSAGGYSALRYAIDLGANGVLTFSPPTSLDVNDDSNASVKLYPQLAALYKNLPDIPLDIKKLYESTLPRPRAIVIYSPSDGRDSWLANRLAGIEGVELIQGPEEAGHRVFAWLERTGEISVYIKQLLASRPLTEAAASPP